MNNNELAKAKVRLYTLLLDIGPDNMTETELNLMYELSKDEQVIDCIE